MGNHFSDGEVFSEDLERTSKREKNDGTFTSKKLDELFNKYSKDKKNIKIKDSKKLIKIISKKNNIELDEETMDIMIKAISSNTGLIFQKKKL